jgi:hypothetical protein
VDFTSALAVAAGLRPSESAKALAHEQVCVAPFWVYLELRARLRRHTRRDDDFDLWITLRNGFVGWLDVIRVIGRDLTYFVFDLVEQWPALGRIINVLLCQY